jgi:enoyl-CoA hydratase/carnithine racemase
MSAVELETLEDNIACVTLNRPDQLNAIDGSLINAMDDALDALSSASSGRQS